MTRLEMLQWVIDSFPPFESVDAYPDNMLSWFAAFDKLCDLVFKYA